MKPAAGRAGWVLCGQAILKWQKQATVGLCHTAKPIIKVGFVSTEPVGFTILRHPAIQGLCGGCALD